MTMEFDWGVATSSHQIEGHNFHNDWWAWEHTGACEGGVTSGAATDHLRLFRQDLKLAKDLGLNSYRFSIEWSRIEPQPDQWSLDGFKFYENLLDECEALGLKPNVTLHHFTSPQWLAERGGFANSVSVEFFSRYVQKVLDQFGPRVPVWTTFNEPMVMTLGGYLGKFMPPAEYAPLKIPAVIRHLLQCHVRGYDLIHSQTLPRTGPWKDHPLLVGLAHNILDFKPRRKWHPMDRALVWFLKRLYNDSWPRAVTGQSQNFSLPGLIPNIAQVKEAKDRKTIDFLGINYYTKAYLRFGISDETWRQTGQKIPVTLTFAKPDEQVSDLGWAVYPKGFERILRWACGFGVPVSVTENGIADESDRLRPKYLKDHLLIVAKLKEEGLPLTGYYYWSLLDNFEWIKGFKPRFGLYRVNYETFDREMTSSADLLKRIIEAHTMKGLIAPATEALADFLAEE